MIELIGSEKQKRWGTQIREDFRGQLGDEVFTFPLDAAWWISHRSDSVPTLIDAAKGAVSSPFTSTFPQHGHLDAVVALSQLEKRPLLILDTETTGIGKGHEIIEIACVDKAGQVLLHTRLHPKRSIIAAATKIHSLTDADVATAPTFPDVWPVLSDLLSTYHPLSYNWQFDGSMIRRTGHAWDSAMPALSGTCIMKLVQSYMELEDTLKLSEACEAFALDQEAFGEAHGAVADARCASALLFRLMECATL